MLSGGEWRQGSNPWHEPGSGGLVYNPPNIVHAMRSAELPLLALWFLWTAAAQRLILEDPKPVMCIPPDSG